MKALAAHLDPNSLECVFPALGSNHKSNIRGNLGKNQGNIVFMSFKVLCAELAYISNSSSPISKFSPALRSPLLNQQGTHPDFPVDCLLIKIDHFHRDHNAPCLSPKLLHNHCFQFLLRIDYAKFWGVSKVH